MSFWDQFNGVREANIEARVYDAEELIKSSRLRLERAKQALDECWTSWIAYCGLPHSEVSGTHLGRAFNKIEEAAADVLKIRRDIGGVAVDVHYVREMVRNLEFRMRVVPEGRALTFRNLETRGQQLLTDVADIESALQRSDVDNSIEKVRIKLDEALLAIK